LSAGVSSVGVIAGVNRLAMPLTTHDGGPMEIDCDRCTMRGRGCHDCVVTVLLGSPPTDTGRSEAGVELPSGALAVAGIAGVDMTLTDMTLTDMTLTDRSLGGLDLDDADRMALRVLADSGLVRPLPPGATRAAGDDRDLRGA
ncbi:MAG: hypothetical protein ACRDP8_23790, partial [Actinopolymorphaceae bacterium]